MTTSKVLYCVNSQKGYSEVFKISHPRTECKSHWKDGLARHLELGGQMSPCNASSWRESARAPSAAAVDALHDLALLELRFGDAADAVRREVGVTSLNEDSMVPFLATYSYLIL